MARPHKVWGHAEPRTLQAMEARIVRLAHALSTALVRGMGHLAAQYPVPTIPCPCGAEARARRMHPATGTTVLGPIPAQRARYPWPTCHHRQTPWDTHVQAAAGGGRMGVQDLLALRGAFPDSGAQAASVLERLCRWPACSPGCMPRPKRSVRRSWRTSSRSVPWPLRPPRPRSNAGRP